MKQRVCQKLLGTLIGALVLSFSYNPIVHVNGAYVRSLVDNDEMNEGQTEDDVESDDTSNGNKNSNNNRLVDLIHLIPFDVEITVDKNSNNVAAEIQTYEVSNIMTDFLNDAYRTQLQLFGYTVENHFAEFNSVVLYNNSDTTNPQQRQRQMQDDTKLFVAKLRGGVVFSRDDVNRTRSIPDNDILVIQQTALLNDTGLLYVIQNAIGETSAGSGMNVKSVNAFLNPSNKNGIDESSESTSDSTSGIDIVIIVAIVVAILAFLFLLGAIIWAYRFDRMNHNAYLLKDHQSGGRNRLTSSSSNPLEKTNSETETAQDADSPERIRPVVEQRTSKTRGMMDPMTINPEHLYPTMIGVNHNVADVNDMNTITTTDEHNYPESVISGSVVSGSAISEDVSTSLSQYYRAGMGKADYGRTNGLLSDAGSVSSMESYGYSLDGGMSSAPMPIPTEIPFSSQDYHRGTRIGGLPIEPANYDISEENHMHLDAGMDDVQIPDLDKELSNLDIHLSSHTNPILSTSNDDESYSQQDLKDYQMEDLENMKHLSENLLTPLSPSSQVRVEDVTPTSILATTTAPEVTTSISRTKSDPVDIDDLDDNASNADDRSE